MTDPSECLPSKPVHPRSIYTPELAAAVCDAYAEGIPFHKIAKIEGMPSLATIFAWQDQHSTFKSALAHARARHGQALLVQADEIMAAVDPDSPYGSARVQLAKSRAEFLRYMAGVCDPSLRENAQVAVQVNAGGDVAVNFASAIGAGDEPAQGSSA